MTASNGSSITVAQYTAIANASSAISPPPKERILSKCSQTPLFPAGCLFACSTAAVNNLIIFSPPLREESK